jgi:hypothetical protein
MIIGMRRSIGLNAFLDGFALGGIFPTRRPGAPEFLFAQEEEECEPAFEEEEPGSSTDDPARNDKSKM